MINNPLLGGYKLQANTNNPGNAISADDYLNLFKQAGNDHQKVNQWVNDYVGQIGESQAYGMGLGYRGPGSANTNAQQIAAQSNNPNYAMAQPTPQAVAQEMPRQMQNQPQGLLAGGFQPRGGQSGSGFAPPRPAGMPEGRQAFIQPYNGQPQLGSHVDQRNMPALMDYRDLQMRGQPPKSIQHQPEFRPQQYKPGMAYPQGYSRGGYRPNRYTGRGMKRGLLGY